MMTQNYATDTLGQLANHVAGANDSRQAVQRVVEQMQRFLDTKSVVFTIAKRSDIWRAEAAAQRFLPAANRRASKRPRRAPTVVRRQAISWSDDKSSADSPIVGTLAWSGPAGELTPGLGEGLLGLLRLTARLFVAEHNIVTHGDLLPAPEKAHVLQTQYHFTQVAAHALRSPIMSLRLHIEHLNRGVSRSFEKPLDAHKLAARLQRAMEQCDSLVGLSDNLLDFYTLQRAPLRLNRATADLNAIIRRVVARFAGPARHTQCTLIHDATDILEGIWDAAYIERAIANVVDNAIRYAPGAPIYLSTQGGRNTATLTIADGGPGVVAGNSMRLFEPFERGQSIFNSSGCGLGLYLTRQFIEAHRGRVAFANGRQQGCTLTIELPR